MLNCTMYPGYYLVLVDSNGVMEKTQPLLESSRQSPLPAREIMRTGELPRLVSSAGCRS